MDEAAHTALMQVIGLAALLVPMLALVVGLAIAARRSRAAERAEPAPQFD